MAWKASVSSQLLAASGVGMASEAEAWWCYGDLYLYFLCVG